MAGDLRLSYAQFEELESFARFGTRLDAATRKTLERGRRVREILKQPQYQPLPVAQQIAMLVAVNSGLLDDVPLADVPGVERRVCNAVTERLPDVGKRIESGETLSRDDWDAIVRVARSVIPGAD
ncbi:MAG: hypothetical protein KatS3mg105_4997 [Gemmatales bacterium]|nr:MAG: hypothetical protein KatS3mg105_4997 [Gemmatales bacterium]